MRSRRQIVTEARKFIGVPFRHEGRDPHVGLNCAGLVLCVAKNCGLLSDEAIRELRRTPHGADALRVAKTLLDEISIDEISEGDLVMSLCMTGEASGIISQSEPRKIIHVDDAVVEELFPPWLNWTISGAFRFRGVQ